MSGETFGPIKNVEAGQKLIHFLCDRLNLPQTVLHRWIRTGQIRLNGSRAKPFMRIGSGDMIRIPPFARLSTPCSEAGFSIEDNDVLKARLHDFGLKFLGRHNGVLALEKPPGLPTQGGTGHADSIASRLASCFAPSPHKPAPCHRLDKGTSGILLSGLDFAAQAALSRSFSAGLCHKEYLARIDGIWPWRKIRLLRGWLAKSGAPGREKVHVSLDPVPGAVEALTLVRPVAPDLLQLFIPTGRTHQIRSQLAREGFPVLGDRKYGSSFGGGCGFCLHAFRIILPDKHEFISMPSWCDVPIPPPIPDKTPERHE